MSQLFRYFSVTAARIAILTNGTEYRFFSDLESSNKMDDTPFFTFDILNYQPADIKELGKFRAEAFAIDQILETANDLKYLKLLKEQVYKEVEEPSPELAELLARRVYGGRLTPGIREWLGALCSQAMKQTIREIVNRRLSDAIDRPEKSISSENVENEESNEVHENKDIRTTEQEIEAFNVIRAMLRSRIEVCRITMRDSKSYCAILLDNNNRKPVARLYLDGKKWRIGLFKDKIEERVEIGSIDDIFQYGDRIINTALEYQ